MNINHLKYFCDAAAHSSISRAAAENYVSQSAISQGISSLEEVIGCKLLSHKKRLFELTPQGVFLLDKGIKILKDLENLSLECKALNEVSGIFSIGMTHSLALACLPNLKLLLTKKYPHLELRVSLAPIEKLEEGLKNGILDALALVRNMDVSRHDFDCVSRGYFRIYNRAEKQNEKPDEILITSKGGHETVVLRSYLNENDQKRIGLIPEVSSWEILARLTAQGFGASLLPDYLEGNDKNKISICKPLAKFKIPYELGLIHRSSVKGRPSYNALRKTFKEAMSLLQS